MTAPSRAVPVPSGLLLPDRLVVEVARVVTIGCRLLAEQDGTLSQSLADLQHDLNVRAAEVRAWLQRRQQRAAAAATPVQADGSGPAGTAVDGGPEPASRSTGESALDPAPWCSTGATADRLGVSSSLLRRWARAGHPASRPGARGYEWDPTWQGGQQDRAAASE